MQRQTVSFIYDLPTLPVIHFEAEGLTEARLVGRHVAVKKTETPSKRKLLKNLKKQQQQTNEVSALLWKPRSQIGEGKFMDAYVVFST